MPKTINFTKVSGAGNDFVLIENLDNKIHVDKSKLAIVLCSRHFGIGGDGLLLLEQSSKADFMMVYYNADGSYGGMCGNGGRCIARYAYLHGIARSTMHFEALDHIYKVEIMQDSVYLHMKKPKNLQSDLLLQAVGKTYVGHFMDTGAPHLVIFEDPEPADVEKVGREIRRDKRFIDGTNVNFVRITTQKTLQIRTYERGVEAETLACGTGAVASALIAALKHGLQSPVSLQVRSGEKLVVHFQFDGTQIIDVILEGSAHILFNGNLEYDDLTNQIVDSVGEGNAPFRSSKP